MTGSTKTAAAREIQIIQIARSSLGMDDDTYRALIARIGRGAKSSKDLTPLQRQAVIAHMKASGFKLQAKRAPLKGATRGEPQLAKLRALWWALADARAVERPVDATACDAAVGAWGLRQIGDAWAKRHGGEPLTALRFADADQLHDLIEQLKQWGYRVGARVLVDVDLARQRQKVRELVDQDREA